MKTFNRLPAGFLLFLISLTNPAWAYSPIGDSLNRWEKVTTFLNDHGEETLPNEAVIQSITDRGLFDVAFRTSQDSDVDLTLEIKLTGKVREVDGMPVPGNPSYGEPEVIHSPKNAIKEEDTSETDASALKETLDRWTKAMAFLQKKSCHNHFQTFDQIKSLANDEDSPDVFTVTTKNNCVVLFVHYRHQETDIITKQEILDIEGENCLNR